MNLSHNQKIPEETEIELLLRRFKPLPSTRYEHKMASAPWNNHRRGLLSVLFVRQNRNPRLVWGLVIILAFLLIASLALIPPIRAIARQIIFSFITSPSNHIEVQVTPSTSGDLFNINDPENFQMTIEQAQQLAGFRVAQITPLPAGLNLVGARYERDYRAVILMYQVGSSAVFLTQRPVGKGQDVFSIGPGAQVKLVKVGNAQGEYVEGGWKAISTQPYPFGQPPESTVGITATWDNSLPQSTLRWQADNNAYELRAVGEDRPSQSELINFANELK